MKAKVQAALEELRPYIQADGGDVELVSAENGIVTLRLTGHCVGCPSSAITLKAGIETHLKKKIPEVREVVQAPPLEAAPVAHQPMVSPFATDLNTMPAKPPDTVTSLLRQTHRKAEDVLLELERALERIAQGQRGPGEQASLTRAQEFLAKEMHIHMRQEDEVLFPALIPFISWGTPMSVMAKEHRALCEEFDAFAKEVDSYKPDGPHEDLIRLGRRIVQHLRDDFYQEENVLFVEADESLTGPRAQALREAMERIAAAVARSEVH